MFVDGGAVFRQCDHRHMDRLADINAGQIDVDAGWDRVWRNHHFNRMLHEVDRATALDPGRSDLVDNMDRHFHLDFLASRQTEKVDMQGLIADRIELVVARNNADFLTIDIDLENGRQEMASENQLFRCIEI